MGLMAAIWWASPHLGRLSDRLDQQSVIVATGGLVLVHSLGAALDPLSLAGGDDVPSE